MSGKPNMLLTSLWKEVEQPVEDASLYTAGVLRIDENALVLEAKAQEGLMVSLGLFAAFVMMIMLPLMLFDGGGPFAPAIFRDMHGGELFFTVVFVVFMTVVMLSLAFIIAPWGLYTFLVRPGPGPIICDRRAGKIYGSNKGKPVELDWKQVKPILTHAIVLAVGIQRYYHLVFFQPETPETWSGTGKHRGKGIMISPGLPWGWGTCAMMYEFIRRYMEEAPEEAAEHLPAVAVALKEEPWVTKLLDRGIYDEWAEPEGRMERLRERDGRPEITLGKTIQATSMAPVMLINLIQVHLRPVMKLPAEWQPAPAAGPSPYMTIEPQSGDIQLRRKAAQEVKKWLIVCVGSGMALYLTGIAALIHYW